MSSRKDCRVCAGAGYLERADERYNRRQTGAPVTTCPACHGAGREPKTP